MIYFWLFIEAVLVLSNNIIAFYFSIDLFDKTNSASIMATSVFLSVAPTIYLSFIAGGVVDRVGKKKTILFCSFLYSLIYLALASHIESYGYTVAIILLAMFLRSAVSSFHDIAIMTLIPEQVEESKLRLAYGIQGFFNKGALIIGPIIAGAIYSFVDVYQVLIYTIACSLLTFLITLLLNEKENKVSRNKLKIRIGECKNYLNSKPVLKVSLIFFCIFNAVNGIASAFLVAYVLLTFGEFEYSLSVYNFFMALGALVGTLYSIKKFRLSPVLLIGLTTIICALLGRFAISFASELIVFSLLLSIRAALIPIGNMANQIIWVEHTEPSIRGGIFGFRRMLAQGFYPISIIICAVLVEVFELESSIVFLKSMFMVSGVIELLVAFILIYFSIRFQKVKEREVGLA